MFGRSGKLLLVLASRVILSFESCGTLCNIFFATGRSVGVADSRKAGTHGCILSKGLKFLETGPCV
jgi:hypothetical protein